jgi:O-antigen/teichoic acid export membrane protein
VGSLGILDLGAGKALTKFTAEALTTKGGQARIPSLFWSGFGIMMLVGCMIGALLLGLAVPLSWHWLRLPNNLRSESLDAFLIGAAVIPIVVVTSGTLGFLEAHQQFAFTSRVRIAQGIVMYVGPLASLVATSRLEGALTMILAGRATLLAFVIRECLRTEFMQKDSQHEWRRATLGALLRFGGWVTMANTAAPLMGYMDRLLIGILLSVSSIAVYGACVDSLYRVQVIPAAISGVAFPAIASAIGSGGIDQARRIYSAASRYIQLFAIPVAFVAVGVAPYGLRLWLGSVVTVDNVIAAQILCPAMLFQSVALVNVQSLLAVGRPDLQAKWQAIQVLPYALLLVFAISGAGIVGAAAAVTIRAAVNVLGVTLLARLVRIIDASAARRSIAILAIGGGACGVEAILSMEVPLFAAILSGIGLVTFVFLAGRFAVATGEREWLVQNAWRRGPLGFWRRAQ